jgi:hypothetical protein
MADMLHVGQIGAVIRLTSTTDISSAVSYEIRFQKPSGATGSWTASLEGTTNVEYTTVDADDLDEAGPWRFQAFATYGGGRTGISTRVSDTIGSVIPAS